LELVGVLGGIVEGDVRIEKAGSDDVVVDDYIMLERLLSSTPNQRPYGLNSSIWK
jgi:hypothetical protein